MITACGVEDGSTEIINTITFSILKWNNHCGPCIRGFWCDVTGSKLFSQFRLYVHVQLFSCRGSSGCGHVCTHLSDHSTFHSPHLYSAFQSTCMSYRRPTIRRIYCIILHAPKTDIFIPVLSFSRKAFHK